MKTFALLYGIVFLLVGILGFFPGLLSPPDPAHEVVVTGFHGQLLGLFPVNWIHNVVHILFGVWGLAASRSWFGARGYARAVAVIYIVLAIMGLIPALNTTFGLIPLHGNDVWLHVALAAVAAYFGWGVKPPADAHAHRTAARV
ncbi:DUF4383 domain-containing protein [Indioceanicola profundi]|uniref:DUF4383 domain-containing protein n=1 Tax=Indioceanicola profundi TaxID=2220096 RepID=UPI000E6ABF15|nr:DUF4383 domain-containing protein [Indioceanicola profundi]